MPVRDTQKGIEVRHIAGAEMRLEDDDSPILTGYAAVFDSRSEDLGFREIVKPGAFKRALAEDHDVRALVDHDPSKIIGRSSAGTLDLEEDARGLRVKILPPDTTVGRDLVESIKRGDIDQMSFAFRTIIDDWHHDHGELVRELIDVDLFDVSAVTYPAYTDTTIAARSLKIWQATRRPSRLSLAKARLVSM